MSNKPTATNAAADATTNVGAEQTTASTAAPAQLVARPPAGMLLIIGNEGDPVVIKKEVHDFAMTEGMKAANSRWNKPLFRYGLMTAVSLVTGGMGFAGGTYVAKRKHDAWVDSQVAAGTLQTEPTPN